MAVVEITPDLLGAEIEPFLKTATITIAHKMTTSLIKRGLHARTNLRDFFDTGDIKVVRKFEGQCVCSERKKRFVSQQS